MKSVPEELKLDETKDKNLALNCYDIYQSRQSECQKLVMNEELKKREKLDKLLNNHY
jgi:hypothetical protein